jgi:CRP-like cAMP-binding protein
MQREEGLALLAASRWLSATPRGFRDALLSGARWSRVEAGEPLTLGGEDRRELIGIAEGIAGVTSVLGPAETPMLTLVHAVCWVGYGPMLRDRARVVTVEARTPLWVATIPETRLLPVLAQTPAWWRCFLPLMAEYGDAAAAIACDLLIRRSDQRLAATILRFANLRGFGAKPAAVTRIPVSQAELAEAANLSRNAAGRILRRFSSQGLIDTDYRGLKLRDPAGLAAVAEGGGARRPAHGTPSVRGAAAPR